MHCVCAMSLDGTDSMEGKLSTKQITILRYHDLNEIIKDTKKDFFAGIQTHTRWSISQHFWSLRDFGGCIGARSRAVNSVVRLGAK